MKKIICSILLITMAIGLTACGGTVEKKVTCTMCNGTGQVKYYYGDGDNDYNMGPCTSCDEKGYTIVTVDKKDSKKKYAVVVIKQLMKLLQRMMPQEKVEHGVRIVGLIMTH